MSTLHAPITRKPLQANRWPQVLSAALLTVVMVASPAHAAAGDLDPTFGNGGKVTTSFGPYSTAMGAASQPHDGKVVVVGWTSGPSSTHDDFALARYNTDGSLDSAFGGLGKVTTDFGLDDHAFDVAVDSNGRIVAAGSSSLPSAESSIFAVARYNPNGTLDSTFGKRGRVTTEFSEASQAVAVVIQPDDKIVVVGGEVSGYALARYNVDGKLDRGFGDQGRVTPGFGGSGADVAIQHDGQGTMKIVVGGTGGGDFTLARFNLDGSIDTSFGAVGKVNTDFGGTSEELHGIAIQHGSEIVAVGKHFNGSNWDVALTRYLPDGNHDATFGVDGKVTTDFGVHEIAHAVALQGDGRIVAAGTNAARATGVVMLPTDFALVRYNSAGGLDPSFGKAGLVTTDFGEPSSFFLNCQELCSSDQARAVVLQTGRGVGTADKIVAAGQAAGDGESSFAIARYLMNN